MKKLLVLAILAIAFCFGQANAQIGPVCIELAAFCDRLELSTDSYGNVYGVWDWTCDGVTLAPVLGRYGPLFNAGGAPVGLGATTNLVFSFGTRLFDLWGTDGSGTWYYQLGMPWTYTMGPCGFPAPGMGNYENSLGYYLQNHK